jgi:hypothetical protein
MQHEKNVQIYDQAFKKIKDETEISDPEEIVSKFAKLHTRNYSLLTYINHMNHEVEALEAVRRERAVAEEAKRARDTGHKATREQALGDIERQLNSLWDAIEQGKNEERRRHGLVHEKLIPHIEHMVGQLRAVPGHLPTRTASLSKAVLDAEAGELGEDPPAIFAREIREDTLPQWLEWVEESLGRYRDLLRPHGNTSAEAFPATAMEAVKDLTSKPKHSDKPPQLVRKEELPAATVGPNVDSAMLTPAQRREQLEEDVDEEEFDTRPFKLKEIRMKAEEAIKRRRTRMERSKHSGGMGLGAASDADPMTMRAVASSLGASSTAHAGGSVGAASGAQTVGYDGMVAQSGSRLQSEGALTQEPELDQTLPPIRDDADEEQEHSELQGDGQDDMNFQASAEDWVREEFRKSARSRSLSEVMARSGWKMGAGEDPFNNKMSRDELRVMAESYGLSVEELCFLKAEFDTYSEDGSGYIEVKDLNGLMARLDGSLSEPDLEQAFTELDADQTGDIEFFDFVQWFTSTGE